MQFLVWRIAFAAVFAALPLALSLHASIAKDQAATVPVAFDPVTGQNVELTAGGLANCVVAGGCLDLLDYYVNYPDPDTGKPDPRRRTGLALAMYDKYTPGTPSPTLSAAYQQIGMRDSAKRAGEGSDLKTRNFELTSSSVQITITRSPRPILDLFLRGVRLPVAPQPQPKLANLDSCVSGDALGCETYIYNRLFFARPEQRDSIIADVVTKTFSQSGPQDANAVRNKASVLKVLSGASSNPEQKATIAEITSTLLGDAGFQTASIPPQTSPILQPADEQTLPVIEIGESAAPITTNAIQPSDLASPN